VIDPKSLAALKATLQILKGLEQDLPEMVTDAPVEIQVEIGHLLSGLAKHANKGLNTVKLSLREAARASLGGQCGTQVLKSAEGARAAVHFRRSTVTLRKDADMEALRTHLGTLFPVFFDTIYVPTKDFQEHLGDLADPTPLLNAVDNTESTPTVKFEDDPD